MNEHTVTRRKHPPTHTHRHTPQAETDAWGEEEKTTKRRWPSCKRVKQERLQTERTKSESRTTAPSPLPRDTHTHRNSETGKQKKKRRSERTSYNGHPPRESTEKKKTNTNASPRTRTRTLPLPLSPPPPKAGAERGGPQVKPKAPPPSSARSAKGRRSKAAERRNKRVLAQSGTHTHSTHRCMLQHGSEAARAAGALVVFSAPLQCTCSPPSLTLLLSPVERRA